MPWERGNAAAAGSKNQNHAGAGFMASWHGRHDGSYHEPLAVWTHWFRAEPGRASCTCRATWPFWVLASEGYVGRENNRQELEWRTPTRTASPRLPPRPRRRQRTAASPAPSGGLPAWRAAPPRSNAIGRRATRPAPGARSWASAARRPCRSPGAVPAASRRRPGTVVLAAAISPGRCRLTCRVTTTSPTHHHPTTSSSSSSSIPFRPSSSPPHSHHHHQQQHPLPVMAAVLLPVAWQPRRGPRRRAHRHW